MSEVYKACQTINLRLLEPECARVGPEAFCSGELKPESHTYELCGEERIDVQTAKANLQSVIDGSCSSEKKTYRKRFISCDANTEVKIKTRQQSVKEIASEKMKHAWVWFKKTSNLF